MVAKWQTRQLWTFSEFIPQSTFTVTINPLGEQIWTQPQWTLSICEVLLLQSTDSTIIPFVPLFCGETKENDASYCFLDARNQTIIFWKNKIQPGGNMTSTVKVRLIVNLNVDGVIFLFNMYLPVKGHSSQIIMNLKKHSERADLHQVEITSKRKFPDGDK